MTINASHISYLLTCHRKLWLAGNGIRMENATDNSFVEEGKLIHETSYERRAQKWKELDLGNLKIDHFDPRTNTVREVKKSTKLEHTHIAQVKYYLYELEQRGVHGAGGTIEYPKLRKTTTVQLSDSDRREIQGWEAEVGRIVDLPTCPELVRKPYCDSCAFRDFCYI